MMKRVPRQHRNKEVRRERDGRALRRQIVLLACGLTAACGFVLAVGQHYAAVRYGYKGEQLREERRHLLAERDRLLMELSAAESPVTLERAARGIGMQPARPSQMGAARRKDGDAGQRQSRDTAGGRAGAAVVRGDSKRDEKKMPESERAARERVAAQGAGDSRPRVVGLADAKGRGL
jgi:hypothetical protein